MKMEKSKQTTQKLQRIIRDYYQQLYDNKINNLEEMDKFLEKYNLPKLNQKEIENLNRSITSTEIETVIKKSSNKQKPRTIWLHRLIQRKANPYPSQTLPEYYRERLLPDSFYEATITLIQKPDKDATQKENYRPISPMNMDAKSSTKFQQTESNNILKISYVMTKWALSQGCKDSSVFANQSM